MRILIVDDAKFQRSNLRRHLTALGHEVVEAEHGQAGLDLLAADPAVEVVFSDLLMPVLDGFAFAEALRTRYPNLPVVVCSADIQRSSRERCESLGVRVFVGKPADQNAIAHALSALEQP